MKKNLEIVSRESLETRSFSNFSLNPSLFSKILEKAAELGGNCMPYITPHIYMPTDESFHRLTLFIEEQMSDIMSNTFDITVKQSFVARFEKTGKMKEHWQDLKNFCKELGGEILEDERVFNFKCMLKLVDFITNLNKFL